MDMDVERSENSDGERDEDDDSDSSSEEDNASNGVSVEEEVSHNSSEHRRHDSDVVQVQSPGYTSYEEEEEEEEEEEDPNLGHPIPYSDLLLEEEEEDGNLGNRYSDDDSDEPSRKRFKASKARTIKRDRLSALPDSVLPHILSFLPTKDAVKTGILSRRWLYLWTSVPNLTFSCHQYMYPQKKFTDFLHSIDQTLTFHRSDLKSFALAFSYHDSLHSRVSSWIRFATRANVEKLSLDLNGGCYYSAADDEDINCYVLPQHLYTNSTITKLKLTLCDLMPSGLISWKALKSLSIKKTTLSEYMIQKILAGSPLLDSLKLHNFCGFECLDIRESNLSKLVLRDYWDSVPEQAESDLEIIAPKLRSLTISGDMRQRKIKLTNVQLLDDCILCFNHIYEDEDDYEAHLNVLRQLLHRLRHVNKLTLGRSCIEVLSTLEEKGVLLPVSERKCLILWTHIYGGDLPGIASILRSSPYLQTLHIDMTFNDFAGYHSDEKLFEKYLTSEKEFGLLSLKIVRIDGLVGKNCRQEHVIPLAKFILKNAKVLEKMVITAQKVDRRRLWRKNSPRELLDVALKLLSLPRSSLQAVVEISK